MSRNERWTEMREINKNFPLNTTPGYGAGPILTPEMHIDSSERHIATFGKTGKGKSEGVSMPFIREVLRKGESGIILDPKKQCYNRMLPFIPEGYQVLCVDLRDPGSSPTGWNPLSLPLRLYRSGDPSDHDRAADMISDLWAGVYPRDMDKDQFWPTSAANLAKGLTYSLFDVAEEDEIHLDSVAAMMEQSETRNMAVMASKQLYDMLPEGCIAKRNLATYVTAPNETRASIHSVAASGMEIFSRSKGLMSLLADDTLNVMDLDVTRPFILFICVADESENYHSLAGLLVSQMTQHLIRKAQDMGGRLPVRVNIVLEELGSVGKSIPNLPNLLAAGRSRNIRMMLVLQSAEQLVDVYGKSKAEAICSCIGVEFCFSSNSWDTLSGWSRSCGERRNTSDGPLEPLITPAQLEAMPTGTALVKIDGRFKYITRLPMFYQMYPDLKERVPQPVSRSRRPVKTFDLVKYVTGDRQRKMDELRRNMLASASMHVTPIAPQEPNTQRGEVPFPMPDIGDLMKRIDERIKDMEEEEKAQNEKKRRREHTVLIRCEPAVKMDVIRILHTTCGMALSVLSKLVTPTKPFEVRVSSKAKAQQLIKEIREAGGQAVLKPESKT